MKIVGYYKPLPITEADSLLDLEIPDPPHPTGHDLLVEVKAISVNPVDVKQRKRATPAAGEAKVLGFDAAGTVIAVGPEASLFKPGEAVYYAGSIERPGSNAQFQLVDERLVGRKPATLDFPEAAALPLTTLTAWELLFERLCMSRGSDKKRDSLLIVGAAGGVGSILTQLARQLTSLIVIGTASRPETREWVISMGAQHVIDHHKSIPEELKRIGIPQVNYAAGLTHTPEHFPAIAEALAPEGKFGLIDDLGKNDIGLFRRKSISFHWEYMFTRSIYKTPDMIAQHNILTEAALLVEDKVIRTTMSENLGSINAANLKEAHRRLESERTTGKLVLSGW